MNSSNFYVKKIGYGSGSGSESDQSEKFLIRVHNTVKSCDGKPSVESVPDLRKKVGYIKPRFNLKNLNCYHVSFILKPSVCLFHLGGVGHHLVSHLPRQEIHIWTKRSRGCEKCSDTSFVQSRVIKESKTLYIFFPIRVLSFSVWQFFLLMDPDPEKPKTKPMRIRNTDDSP
jgi:hypothetical protein